MSKSLYQTQIENRAPTSSDTAVIGNWWIDTSASPNALYLYKASGWELQGASSGGVQQDTSATSVATLYSALNSLRTAGKSILSIEFTPTSSIAATQIEYSTPLTAVEFTRTSSTVTFLSSKKHVLTLIAINGDGGTSPVYKFSGSSPSTATPEGPYFVTIRNDGFNASLNRIIGGSAELRFQTIDQNITTTVDNRATAYTINYI